VAVIVDSREGNRRVIIADSGLAVVEEQRGFDVATWYNLKTAVPKLLTNNDIVSLIAPLPRL
jgi:hypothetical protein